MSEETFAFCLNCGAHDLPLFHGLCPPCYQESLPENKLSLNKKIMICTTCGALHLPSIGWTRPLNYDEFLLELDTTARALIPTPPTAIVESESVEDVDLSLSRPEATIRLIIKDQPIPEFPVLEETASVTFVIEKGICETCSNIKNRVHNAVLQLRADRRKVSETEEDLAVDIIKSLLKQTISEAHSSYLLDIIEVRGGLDFLFSDRYLANLAAQAIIHKFGGFRKETFKLVGEDKDGTKKYKSTIVVRIPLLRTGDWIILQDQPHLIIKHDRLGIIVRKKGVGKAKRYEWNTIREAVPINSQILQIPVQIIAKLDDSFLVMDSRSYETFEIALEDMPFETEIGMNIILGEFEGKRFFYGFKTE